MVQLFKGERWAMSVLRTWWENGVYYEQEISEVEFYRRPTMQDIMIDLETLGTLPGSVILSIGAVAFDELSVAPGAGFYKVISTISCESCGLTKDEATEKWWLDQGEE